MISESILKKLNKYIPMVRLKNNHKVWVSSACPFCEAQFSPSKSFRYNTKLKVMKCFNCGWSCKELSTLKKELETKGVESFNRMKKWKELKEKFDSDDLSLPF
jgi:transcription elongation factor Elf1